MHSWPLEDAFSDGPVSVKRLTLSQFAITISLQSDTQYIIQ